MRPGHPAELLEGSDVAVDEDLLGLVGIDPVEGLARGRQPHDEHPADDQLAAESRKLIWPKSTSASSPAGWDWGTLTCGQATGRRAFTSAT